MAELFKTLAAWLLFFFDGNRYRLVGSEVGLSFGDALITWSSDIVIWRIVRDRGQIFLDCRPVTGKADCWYSTDLLIKLLAKQNVSSAELTAENAAWVEANLLEIEQMFTGEKLEQSVKELSRLKKNRAKELFG